MSYIEDFRELDVNGDGGKLLFMIHPMVTLIIIMKNFNLRDQF